MTRNSWLLALCLSIVACEPEKKTSSETHFISCATDAECTSALGPGHACSAGECRASVTLVSRPDAGPDSGPQRPCGDGVCSAGETRQSCPVDCNFCGDGYCDTNESQFSCPNDCAFCGDGVCAFLESVSNCPADCGDAGRSYGSCNPAFCPPEATATPCCLAANGPCGVDYGNGCVTRRELARADGGGYCGDGHCDSVENRFNCPEDCAYCGDGVCASDEDRFSCPNDCGFCGDGQCGSGETRTTCPADCP
jgi:hypothetical protein